MSRSPSLDWEGFLWEARGYLGLDEDAPVPLYELRETAEANGWSKREFRENHVAQAAGRYGRNADDPTNTATVFVRPVPFPRTSLTYRWPALSGSRRNAASYHRGIAAAHQHDGARSGRAADVSKRHVAKTLVRFLDTGGSSVTKASGCTVLTCTAATLQHPVWSTLVKKRPRTMAYGVPIRGRSRCTS